MRYRTALAAKRKGDGFIRGAAVEWNVRGKAQAPRGAEMDLVEVGADGPSGAFEADAVGAPVAHAEVHHEPDLFPAADEPPGRIRVARFKPSEKLAKSPRVIHDRLERLAVLPMKHTHGVLLPLRAWDHARRGRFLPYARSRPPSARPMGTMDSGFENNPGSGYSREFVLAPSRSVLRGSATIGPRRPAPIRTPGSAARALASDASQSTGWSDGFDHPPWY